MDFVKSAWASKINWTQAVALASVMLAFFGIDVPPDVQVKIVGGIAGVAFVVTAVLRTWFTTAITYASQDQL